MHVDLIVDTYYIRLLWHVSRVGTVYIYIYI